jgi:hypothetical protein
LIAALVVFSKKAGTKAMLGKLTRDVSMMVELITSLTKNRRIFDPLK